MQYSPFLSKEHWPLEPMPENLFRHFVDTRFYSQEREFLDLYEREDFLNALNTSEKFSKFWISIQEQHPSKRDYFLSLTNEEEPYNSRWIELEYNAHLRQSAFEALSDQERRELEQEFIGFWVEAYQAALKGESLRLKCNINDVRPTSHVLPWKPDDDEEFTFDTLPNEIFGRIFLKLETIDIFRMTLVCRKWKQLVHDSRKHLKKAEHAVTTHLITFTDWMDPTKTPSYSTFFHQYQSFSWCLTRWYCGISENLETLILDHPVPHVYLATLLQSCPNLKQLRIGHDSEAYGSTFDTMPTRVHLKNLEVFIPLGSHHGRRCPREIYRHLNRDILVSSQALRVFRGALSAEDLIAIDGRRRLGTIFTKLIVLDLHHFETSTLEVLASIDNLQLKYLKLGVHYRIAGSGGLSHEEKKKSALHKLLPKLGNLKMLTTSPQIGVTNETIQLITSLELNLERAVLFHSYFPLEYDEDEEGVEIEVDSLQPDVVFAFRNMLLAKSPNIDLSEIYFVLHRGETLKALQGLKTGFTFTNIGKYDFETNPDFSLNNSKIKRQFGIEF